MRKSSIASIYKSIYSQLSKQNLLVKDFLELAAAVEEELKNEFSGNGKIPLNILSIHENGIDLVLKSRENQRNFKNALSISPENETTKSLDPWYKFSNIFFYSFAKLNETILKFLTKDTRLPIIINNKPIDDFKKSVDSEIDELKKVIKKLKKERDIFLTPKVKLNENVKVYLHLLEKCDLEKEISLEMLEQSSNNTRSKSSWHNDTKLLSFWLRLEELIDEKINLIEDKISKSRDEFKKVELISQKVKLIARLKQIQDIIDTKAESRASYNKKFKRNIDLNKLSGNVNSEQPENPNEYFRNQLNYKSQTVDENYIEDEDKRGIREGYYSSLEDPYINNNSSNIDPETDYKGSNDIETSETETPEKEA